MTTVHTLASGSSGNALVLTSGCTHLLVDAGISCRRILRSLEELELAPEDLDALLITHTHGDHISGLWTLLKRTEIPVWGSAVTCRQLRLQSEGFAHRFRDLALCRPAVFGCCTVTPFPTSHDTPGSCGYRIDTPDGSLGILTDSGFITGEAEEVLSGIDLAVLEFNHDVETLVRGDYPYYLKERILGPEGHLSNETAAGFAVTLAEHGASEFILAHLSAENNTPAMARSAIEAALSAAGFSTRVSVAPRSELSEAHYVRRNAVCRK